MAGTVLVELADWDSPDGARLRAAQRAELDARYGNSDHEPGEPPSAGSVAVFVIARAPDGTPLGCGGLRFLDHNSAEIKRMYVVPTARGTGIAVAILRALEERARRRGVESLLLETGTAQPDAMRFYEREGYRRIDNFGPYRDEPLSVCYARQL
ncbi:GNAT family N-acetyltransferase [Plantactinospora sp. B5E13]|uniref:GNAT family N-acetyltransferase n=1 Tax=unclassified Plantactinospora TaxID=2631981 RepID=UPI00325D53A4